MLKINKDILKQCCADQKIQRSIALSMCIKREYGNSVIYDYTLDKLMKLTHGSYSVIKDALNIAISNKAITKQSIQKKDGTHTNLKANKLYGEHKTSVKFGIIINNGGHKVLYIIGKTNKNIAESSTEPQTFKEVCDMISEAWIMLGLDRHKLILNTSERVKENTASPSEFIDTGISYDGISKFFADGFYSRKQIIRLIKDMRDKGLLMWKHCSVILYERDPESCLDRNYHAKYSQMVFDGVYNWINRKTGEVVKWAHHSYWGKGTHNNKRFRPLCNQYTILSPAISYNCYTPKTPRP